MGTGAPKPHEADHTELVHVLWAAKHRGMSLADADALATFIRSSEYHDAVRRQAVAEFARELLGPRTDDLVLASQVGTYLAEAEKGRRPVDLGDAVLRRGARARRSCPPPGPDHRRAARRRPGAGVSPGIQPPTPPRQKSSAESWRIARAAGQRRARLERSEDLMAGVRRPLVWGRSTYKTIPNDKDAGPWHVTQTLPDSQSTGIGLCGSQFGHSERSHRFVDTRVQRPTWSERCCPDCVRLERTVPPAP